MLCAYWLFSTCATQLHHSIINLHIIMPACIYSHFRRDCAASKNLPCLLSVLSVLDSSVSDLRAHQFSFSFHIPFSSVKPLFQSISTSRLFLSSTVGGSLSTPILSWHYIGLCLVNLASHSASNTSSHQSRHSCDGYQDITNIDLLPDSALTVHIHPHMRLLITAWHVCSFMLKKSWPPSNLGTLYPHGRLITL